MTTLGMTHSWNLPDDRAAPWTGALDGLGRLADGMMGGHTMADARIAAHGGNDDPETALMLRVAEGDPAAFEALYRRYRDPIVRYCRRYVYEQARAEEIAQEVFVDVYKARHKYSVKAKFRTWLYTLATNRSLKAVRGVKNRATHIELDAAAEPLDGGDTPDDALHARMLAQQLESALQRLPDAQRGAFVLVCVEGFGHDEAADALGVSVSATKSLVFRARTEIKKHLQPFLATTAGGDI